MVQQLTELGVSSFGQRRPKADDMYLKLISVTKESQKEEADRIQHTTAHWRILNLHMWFDLSREIAEADIESYLAYV